MPDEKHDPYGIRRNLIRVVVTEPLGEEIRKKPAAVAKVIFVVNLRYYEGRDKAFERVAGDGMNAA